MRPVTPRMASSPRRPPGPTRARLQRTNVLTESGIVRRDITSSFGASKTKATGVPLTITMTINEFDNDKKPLAGGAVYLWHCDQARPVPLYSQAVVNENYLRGVQETDGSGRVSFTTIFPACYSGAGRTSTSRSTRVWPRPPAARTRSRRPRWR